MFSEMMNQSAIYNFWQTIHLWRNDRTKTLWFGCLLLKNLNKIWFEVISIGVKRYVYAGFSALDSLTVLIMVSLSLQAPFKKEIYISCIQGDREGFCAALAPAACQVPLEWSICCCVVFWGILLLAQIYLFPVNIYPVPNI